MNWILDNVGTVIALVVFGMIVRGVMKALRQAAEAQNREAKRKAALDPEAAERTRRIQEEIRRKIAERRAGGGPLPRPAPAAPAPSPLQRIPPLVRPLGVPPLDTFGGPTQRVPKPVAPAPAPEPENDLEPEEDATTALILERQRQLQEQMRALEAKRQAEQKRAAEVAAAQRDESAAAKGAPLGRRELAADLRDVHALRRAIVLREVLGTPVGLR